MTDECLLWTGALQSAGYGAVKRNGRVELAHRVAYERACGPIPAGMHILHSCDNRRCVNPAHLRVGTNADNVVDKVAKGRQAKGRACGAVVPDATVAEVRRLYAAGDISQAELGRRFGVSHQSISEWVRGFCRK